MRKHPYTGPQNTHEFDGLDPDQAASLIQAYRLLGDAFETSTDAGLIDRVWLLDDPLALVAARRRRMTRAGRELTAAVKLARHRGQGWAEIGESLGISESAARARYGP